MALPRELAQLVELAHRTNPTWRAYTSLLSLKDATQAFHSLPQQGKLYGHAIAVKDLFCTCEFPTTASSRFLQHYASPIEATVVSRLKAQGGLIFGKANMDEFGMGSANIHSHFGPTLNPSGPETSSATGTAARVAGGSSGGSAAAVAARIARIALASDTGGSTRLPAAYCGVLGFKPSYGLLSRWGMIAYASSLDCVGIMAKEVEDVQTTFDVLQAHDPKDPTSTPQDVRLRITDRTNSLPSRWKEGDLTGLRIGVPAEYFLSELSPFVLPPLRCALQSLQNRGAILRSISLPWTPSALSAYYVLASAEASSNLARFDGIRFGTRSDPPSVTGPGVSNSPLYASSRSSGFGKEVQKRLLLGTYALTAEAFDNYFLQAQRVRRLIREEFDQTFRRSSVLTNAGEEDGEANEEGVDLLLYPSAISTAPLLSAVQGDEVSGYVQDVLNVPASLAGLPAISVPFGRSQEDGWPVGVQLAGQWGEDGLVLVVAKLLQEEA
ncbi:hypothetical protein MVLG_02766 [Microbotryum lychnidis-dioicae p1A1 Lamole]|uniref:Glutamyl-tRNA(Gln) amidotransferase subunit A, mitochondrial n=1 Tax=Microbotryum lychnidis-dioicae (strain p1A1 Lamole / MvSl-1064) TaxID=683840 RepID=U5H662_USTV1|nr:hypothetical protein MVLG_02766 [Microbotryum lychnidis-dioicae p1A1 Lamole]|eukprot:KDE06878.1 hypothetical protein MVLG_02766 [Microbotryum lychnidis-dioicae p1A1 Lamole]